MARVLLVDDDDDTRMLAAVALTAMAGHDVVEAVGGEEAVALASSAAPDVVVVDLRMPRMDGPATIRALRELPAMAAVPVVVMTAASDPAERAGLEGLDVAAVIVKPFDPLGLAAQLGEVLGGAA